MYLFILERGEKEEYNVCVFKKCAYAFVYLLERMKNKEKKFLVFFFVYVFER